MTEDAKNPTDEQVDDLELTDTDAEGVAGGITMVERSFLLPAVQQPNVEINTNAAMGDGSV